MADYTEMDWDTPIKNESGFILLPEGDYDFVIDHLDRARFKGSEKIKPCNMADVYFNITAPDGKEAQIKESYILDRRLMWKMAELFKGVGLMREDDEEIPAKWNQLPGLAGRAHVIQVPGSKDPSKMFNQIKELYPKKLNSFTAGAFS